MKKNKFFNAASALLLAVFVGAMSFTCGQSDNKATDEVQTEGTGTETVDKNSTEKDTTAVEAESPADQNSTAAPKADEVSENTDNQEAPEKTEAAEGETAPEESK